MTSAFIVPAAAVAVRHAPPQPELRSAARVSVQPQLKAGSARTLRSAFHGSAVADHLRVARTFQAARTVRAEAFDGMPGNIYAAKETATVHKNRPIFPLKRPVRVAITGAAGQIGYLILGRIANGDMLGRNQPIILQCLEIEPAMKAMEGVKMELEDSCYPLLKDVVVTTDPRVAFKDADFVLLIGSRPRAPGMERADLLRINGPIFVDQGKALNEVARKDCRVLVVGNPANTNALIAATNAPNIPIENFSAMTRLDQNRAVSMLARKAGCSVDEVYNVICWGNHSPTLYPDVFHATVNGKPAVEAIPDSKWLADTYLDDVQHRAAKVLELRGMSSATSAANAIVQHVHDWALGSDGKWVSMGLYSDGSYDVPPGVFYSVPVVTDLEGNCERVSGLQLNETEKAALAKTRDELFKERELVKDFLGPRQ
eukprot:tig00020510_g9857.t1